VRRSEFPLATYQNPFRTGVWKGSPASSDNSGLISRTLFCDAAVTYPPCPRARLCHVCGHSRLTRAGSRQHNYWVGCNPCRLLPIAVKLRCEIWKRRACEIPGKPIIALWGRAALVGYAVIIDSRRSRQFGSSAPLRTISCSWNDSPARDEGDHDHFGNHHAPESPLAPR
jgi:hypothetical protein